jgi:hypothetical protein
MIIPCSRRRPNLLSRTSEPGTVRRLYASIFVTMYSSVSLMRPSDLMKTYPHISLARPPEDQRPASRPNNTPPTNIDQHAARRYSVRPSGPLANLFGAVDGVICAVCRNHAAKGRRRSPQLLATSECNLPGLSLSPRNAQPVA